MENPRPEKVAVVEEVRDKLASTEAVLFTEYRGLTVRDLHDLRRLLRDVGGEYKVYKNTLVRRATNELDLDLGDTLTGPTALAFVGTRPDGTPGDAVLVAKAIKAFARTNHNLVIKGGRLGEQMLDEAGVVALADVAPREELLARLASGIAAPMTNFARLLQAVPQKMAYALQALIEQQGGAPTGDATTTGSAADGAVSEDTPVADAADTEASATAEAATNNAQTNNAQTNNDEAPAQDADAAAGDADAAEE